MLWLIILFALTYISALTKDDQVKYKYHRQTKGWNPPWRERKLIVWCIWTSSICKIRALAGRNTRTVPSTFSKVQVHLRDLFDLSLLNLLNKVWQVQEIIIPQIWTRNIINNLARAFTISRIFSCKHFLSYNN